MDQKEKLEARIHHTMSMVGGFFGAYALLNRVEIFGSSETSNMIYMVMNFMGRNSWERFFRIIAVIIYMVAFMITVILPKYTKVNMRIFSIGIDIIVTIALGFFPVDMNPIVALYPIFFVMAVQWNSFKSANGYVSATIFSTNNLRQATMSFTNYLLEKDKKHIKRARFFGGSLLCYHIGVVISYIGYKLFSVKGAWLCLIPLTFSLILVKNENRVLSMIFRNPFKLRRSNYVYAVEEDIEQQKAS